ncbi:MAG: hypothetical protein H6907_18905 [Hyphomicrobiales bacterium]|nr:hypothetical protein [Hyphomicrobiales bacterium]
MQGLLRAGAVLAILAAAQPAQAGRDRPTDPLFRAYYAFEVAQTCGLATPKARRGFERTVADLLARRPYSDLRHRRLRHRAWIEAEWEWHNRGLGGNRAWCQGEGMAARERFEGYGR